MVSQGGFIEMHQRFDLTVQGTIHSGRKRYGGEQLHTKEEGFS